MPLCPSKYDLGHSFNEIHSTWQASPLPGLSVWLPPLLQLGQYLHVLLLYRDRVWPSHAHSSIARTLFVLNVYSGWLIDSRLLILYRSRIGLSDKLYNSDLNLITCCITLIRLLWTWLQCNQNCALPTVSNFDTSNLQLKKILLNTVCTNAFNLRV